MYLKQHDFDELLRRVPQEIIIAVDEAYFDYAKVADYPSTLKARGKRERLMALRTFSKAYGLAGLRIGYAVMPAELAGYMNRVRMPFNTGSVAQVAAEAALSDIEHIERSVSENNRLLGTLSRSLEKLGLHALPSQGNFVLVDASRPGADRVYQALLRRGVIVRPVPNYGLPNHLRITVGTEAECARLERSLEQILA